MTTTPYTDIFAILNPHLYKIPTIGERPFHVHSVFRNPPHVVVREDDVRKGLAKFFQGEDVVYSPHTVWFPNQIIDERRPSVKCVQLPKVIDLNYMWATEYFHFFTEVLPNALFLFNNGVKYPIFCRTSPFTVDAFKWFEITNDIIPAYAPLNTIHIVAPYVECGNPSYQKIQLLRHVVEKKVNFEKTHGILIRRHRSREILNENEVLSFLKERYPELIWEIFDTLSIPETAELFSKAARIVGPHGAGMTNMIFAPKGVEILEFMPVSDPNICYWHLSEMLGHSYTMFPAPCDYTNSMLIDINELTQIQCSKENTNDS